MESKYIDPQTDFGFKKIFVNENHKSITIAFINSILKLETPIESIEFSSLKRDVNLPEDKSGVFDIFCTDEKGREIIVGLQRASQSYFVDRSISHACKQVLEKRVKGDSDYTFKPIYFIGILGNGKVIKGDKFMTKASFKDDRQECLEVANNLKFVYIELEKFNKSEDELLDGEEWIYFIKNLDELKKPLFQDRVEFQEAFSVAKTANLKKSERIDYEISIKESRDRFAEIKTSYEQGVKDTEERVRLKAYQEKLEMAKNFLDVLDIQTVSIKTGLSVEEIEALS